MAMGERWGELVKQYAFNKSHQPCRRRASKIIKQALLYYSLQERDNAKAVLNDFGRYEFYGPTYEFIPVQADCYADALAKGWSMLINKRQEYTSEVEWPQCQCENEECDFHRKACRKLSICMLQYRKEKLWLCEACLKVHLEYIHGPRA